jgi:hypothetical protein
MSGISSGLPLATEHCCSSQALILQHFPPGSIPGFGQYSGQVGRLTEKLKMKLTDTHRTILAAGGARDSFRVLPLPKGLKLAGAKKETLLKALLGGDLIAEEPVVDGDVEWRTADTGKLTLVVTAAGLKAVGIETTEEPDAHDTTGKSRKTRKAPQPNAKAGPKAFGRKKKSPAEPHSSPRAGSKLEMLIAALTSKRGATIEELSDATGWQTHSVRGAISGALKKKRELNVISSPVDGRGRVYRIAE